VEVQIIISYLDPGGISSCLWDYQSKRNDQFKFEGLRNSYGQEKMWSPFIILKNENNI